MAGRLSDIEPFTEADLSFDPWIYRFVLTTLILGLSGNVIRLFLSWRSFPGELMPYGGAPVSIAFLGTCFFILWRRPRFLHTVAKTVFVVLTLRIALQLIYIQFTHHAETNFQFIWLSGLMSINYLLPFFLFRHRVALILAAATLGLWILLTGIYIIRHFQIEEFHGMLVAFSQLYSAQGILIIFMALFARLRGLYLVSRGTVVEMEYIANTDFLLGIPNRRSVQVELERRFSLVTEGTKAPFSVVLLDIDHFKEINDRYGHSVGDDILIEVAAIVSRFVKPVGFFGRWGGEEFLIALPNADETEAYTFSQQIRESLERHPFKIGQVTASFGVALLREDGLETLLKRADDALYMCKKLGRNRVEIGGTDPAQPITP